MRAEFYGREGGDEPVGSARWTGDVQSEAGDDDVRGALSRIFRPTPVVVDDPALRSFGTNGPSVLQPGTLAWFRWAARTRSEAEGLTVRFIPEEQGTMGWDPAGAYRTFTEQLAHRARESADMERT